MITTEELQKLVNADHHRCTKVLRQRAYVTGKHPGILAPYPKEEPDNRIPVPFAHRAINMVLGYLFKPGNITYSGDGYTKELQTDLDMNDEGLQDMELAVTALSHGEAYELHWTEESKDQFAQVPIEQCIAIYDDSIRPQLIGFIRHWKKDNVHYAVAYDDSESQKFVSQNGAGWTTDGPATSHGYGRVPIVRFCISRDGSNLFDHVVSMMDFYDKIMSEDFADELARFANAYLLMGGQLNNTEDDVGETEVDKIKRTRMFQNLGTERAVTDAIAFLTRNVNDAFINSAADRTERLIYEMLQLFNPNDASFATASGVAQKYKLLGFEYLCTSISTYFQIGLQDRIALMQGLTSNMSGGPVADTQVTINWKRNLPDDLVTLAQVVSLLQTVLSKETILKLFPDYIVDDVDDEMGRIADEPNAFDMSDTTDTPEQVPDAGSQSR